MVIEVGKIQGQKVYPVCIKYKGRAYLTLYYYTERSDSLLHDEEKILCFRDFAAIKGFCDCCGLLIGGETGEYDFEIVCPYCNNEFVTDLKLMNEEKTEIRCPECNNIIELDWNDDEDEGCQGHCDACHGCMSDDYEEYNDEENEDDM